MSTGGRNTPNGSCEDGFPFGGGGTGKLMRAFDWSTTSLGPIAGWPAHLKGAVSLMLPAKAQIVRCRLGSGDRAQVCVGLSLAFAGSASPPRPSPSSARRQRRGRNLCHCVELVDLARRARGRRPSTDPRSARRHRAAASDPPHRGSRGQGLFSWAWRCRPRFPGARLRAFEFVRSCVSERPSWRGP